MKIGTQLQHKTALRKFIYEGQEGDNVKLLNTKTLKHEYFLAKTYLNYFNII